MSGAALPRSSAKKATPGQAVIAGDATVGAASPAEVRTGEDAVPKKTVSRRTRSRENTRMKLVDAAQRVMSEKGVEATTIADITDSADVGFGSFYNHFASKDEIVSAIVTGRANAFIAMVRVIMANERDISTGLAFNIKSFLSQAIADPIWGWFVVRAQGLVPQIDDLLRSEIKKDLQRGVREGGYDIDVETASRITLGALLSVMRAILEGTASPDAIRETAEYLLRLYGVPAGKARELSCLPLPAYLNDPSPAP